MEVQFNNEDFNMFVFLAIPCPNFPLFLIDPQPGLNRRLQKIWSPSLHLSIFLLLHMLLRDTLLILVSALYHSLHVSSPKTLSFIWRLDSPQMHFTLFGIFRQKTRMREYEKQKYLRRQK